MRVAVLTLTRDRLDYTRHCFRELDRLAGCDYDHYVRDQGSEDGTVEWLERHRDSFECLNIGGENVGINRGLNELIQASLDRDAYDAYVKFDNDCELLVDGTLETAASLVAENPNWILSPHIQGLNQPPPVQGEKILGGQRVGLVPVIGGIFMAVPARVYLDHGYRHNEQYGGWGMDDAHLGSWFTAQGGALAYLLDYPANHYETTEGQKVTYPEYWDRKKIELGIA